MLFVVFFPLEESGCLAAEVCPYSGNSILRRAYPFFNMSIARRLSSDLGSPVVTAASSCSVPGTKPAGELFVLLQRFRESFCCSPQPFTKWRGVLFSGALFCFGVVVVDTLDEGISNLGRAY